MKEQSQQPMTPMAFYPTWQDPSQGWQSQYIQQIPQNTTGISAINSLEFQPQGYAPYQPTGYVHGFDPNYGRSYGAPVQRYDFQSNQIPPINQVSLQSVSFAPSASYAGQVSTGPSPMLLGGQNDLNKTMSGNDMPGYPRVSSVPQHSLNCNGYSGEFNSGNQNSTSSLDSNHKGSQSQQQNTSVPQSHINQTSQQNCNPMEGGLMTDPNGLIKSNGLRQPMDSMNQWKSPANGLRPPIESNSHWKSPSDDVHHQHQQNSQTGHFLSYSHHLRDLNTDGLNNNNSSDNLFPVQPNLNVEPNGGGGAGSHWKSNLNALHVPPESKPPDDFQCSQPQTQHQATPTSKNPEKPAKKPTPKRQRKKPNASTQSTKQSTDDKKNSSDFMPNFNNKGNDMYGSIGSAYGSSNTKFGPIPNENSNTSTSAASYFHGADPLNPYSEFNVKIKQEPLGSLPPRQPYPIPPASASGTNYPIKMEGYEQNYQNFINYADYCQSQSQSSSTTTTTMSSTIAAQQQHQHQSTEYSGQSYGNYPPYSNAAYQHAHHHQGYSNNNSSYTNSSGVPNFSSIPSADTNCNPNTNQTMSTGETADIKPFIRDSNADNKNLDPKSTTDLTKLTNYEKDIPIHTYPNHGRFTDNNNHTNGNSNSSGSSHQAADGMKTHKIDDEHSSTSHKDHLNNDKLKSDDMDLEKAYTSAERVAQMSIDRTEKGMKPEVPDCDCFPSDEKSPPEPGSYYTHLGCASTLAELRADMENRIGIRGRQLRIEKVIYSGKEGKTAQGCPLAKWVLRRNDKEEKILCIVKRRQGHKCKAAFIVVCIVAWDGMPKQEADNSYRLLIHKLNKFGLPTTRRCATNENRTCACQGLDPETSGASFSFGCSWSMYYNGCKYARSKTVRKFRLSVKSEESEIEDHMNVLATMLSPLYKMIAPKAYENQCKYESEAPDCRLGLKAGKPFSGVTTCMDFCAHAHRDLHNMQDGCTVQVGLLKPKTPGYSNDDDDEQLHILPLYIMDTSDEFDNVEAQKDKNKTGAVQVLEKFPCEVRVRATPLLPCRRHGKKRNGKDIEDEPGTPTEETAPPTPAATPAPPTPNPNKKECGGKKSGKNQTKQQPNQPSPNHPLSRAETPNIAANPLSGSNNSTTSGSPSNLSAFSAPNQNSMMNSNSNLINMASMIDNFTDAQLQSNQISSTVLDSPYSYDYATGSYIDKRNYYNQQWIPPHAMEYGYPPADRHEQVKSRSSEENPDSTTLINANNNNSAFSPSVDAVKKQQLLLQQQPEYPTYGYHHSAQSAYPMYPTYSTPAYNQVQQDYPSSALRYNFYSPHHPHHQTYNPYDIYHHAQPGQTQTSPPNWNLFSPAAPSAVPVLTPSASVPTPAASQTNHSVEPLPTLTTLSPSMVANPDVNNEQQQQQQQQPPQQQIHQQPRNANNSNLSNEQRNPPNPQKSEPIGEITEINDNLECFQDVQMGGVGIALEHGSVLIECAKHEMHATTSLKKPNRKNPTRITLIFYQHRNLNRHRHGIEEWEEKMRLKRLGITIPTIDEPKNEAPATKNTNKTNNNATKPKSKPRKSRARSDKPKKEKTISSVESIKETISSVV